MTRAEVQHRNDGMPGTALLTLLACVALTLTACTTTAQRKAAERAAIEKEAAQEIARICALPEPQRQAELARLRKETAMALYCAKQD